MVKVALTINSRQYDVVAEESEEYIKMLGTHINEKVTAVLKDGRNILGERPIVLAALNICDEYYKSEESAKLIKEQLRDSSQRIKELERENKRLRAQITPKTEEADVNQISIDEAENKAEAEAAKNQLGQAQSRIKSLEGQVSALEDKLLKLQKDYSAREEEILEMIDKDMK